MRIRLFHARILTMDQDRYIEDGEVWIENKRILFVGTKEEAKAMPTISFDREKDCCKNLLLPGFKNAHTHSGMVFLRSKADDYPLQKWLNELVFPMEAKLTGEDVYELTRLAILEYLTSGITSIFEMYLDTEAIAGACEDTGMRCVQVGGLNSYGGSIKKLEENYHKLNQPDSLNSFQMGIHAEYTCSEQLLREVSEMIHDYRVPLYTHLAETKTEVESCLAHSHMTPAVYLDSLGLFDFGGGGFHCVHMTNDDIRVFREKGLYVVTNPASNLKLASGIAPIQELINQDIVTAIGTDGAASNNCLDMFREMFLVTGLAKVRENDAAVVPAEEVLKMACVSGAKAMKLTDCECLKKGSYADMILIDLSQPNMQPLLNPVRNLVYSGSKQNVKMTMINGKVLYEDGQFFIGEDKQVIYDNCERICKRLFH